MWQAVHCTQISSTGPAPAASASLAAATVAAGAAAAPSTKLITKQQVTGIRQARFKCQRLGQCEFGRHPCPDLCETLPLPYAGHRRGAPRAAARSSWRTAASASARSAAYAPSSASSIATSISAMTGMSARGRHIYLLWSQLICIASLGAIATEGYAPMAGKSKHLTRLCRRSATSRLAHARAHLGKLSAHAHLHAHTVYKGSPQTSDLGTTHLRQKLTKPPQQGRHGPAPDPP